MKNLVSIIMNCHNGNSYIKKSISSVIDQTYERWELIFWNNASTEPSIVEDIYKNNNKIKYFYNSKFTSLGEARNLAISKAKGEFIAFLDVDDYWHPKKLEKQVLLFNDSEIGLSYTNASIFNEKKTIRKAFSPIHLPSGNVFGKMLSSYFIVMSSVIIKRDVLNKLNIKFNPKYEIIEEYDVFLRIALFYKIAVEKNVLTFWRWNGLGTTAKKRKLMTKEKRLLLKSLIKEYPYFQDFYKNEILIVKNKIFMSIVINLYYSGKSKKSRILLLQSNLINLKGFIIYFLSYLKPSNTSFLYEKIKGNPLV